MSENVPAQIVALERAALDRSDAGDGSGFLSLSAPDIVYQDPSLTAPIEGLAALIAYYVNFASGPDCHGTMANTKVQTFGAIAVLSFHYVVRQQEVVVREWNCSEVYRRIGSDWRIVNTHWSLTKPQPQTPG